jgi:hypothetical protein
MFSMSTRFGFSLVFLMGILLAVSATAQVAPAEKLEIVLDEDQDSDLVVPDSAGVTLLQQRETDGKPEIVALRLNTSLKSIWRKTIPVEFKGYIVHAKVTGNIAFILIKHQTYSITGFELVLIDLVTREHTNRIISNVIPFVPQLMEINQTSILLGGYFNYRPMVLHYLLTTEQSRILPGFFNETGSLDQIRANPDGTFDVVVTAPNVQRRGSVWVRNYTGDGTLQRTVLIEPEEKKSLLFSRSFSLPSGKQVIVGSYGRYNNEYSRGIFVARVEPSGEYQTRYYGYADLKNFFKYLKQRKQTRIQERIERKSLRGKKAKFTYRLMIHELIPYQNQLVMLGEAFFPKYRQVNSRGSTFYILDSFMYTHAVVLGFSPSGELQWDNCFEINDVETRNLQQFVRIRPTSQAVTLQYLFDGYVKTKVIQRDEVIENKNSLDLLNRQPTRRRQLNRIEAHLDYWTNDSMLAYGVRPLATNTEDGKRVFFIYKLKFSDN